MNSLQKLQDSRRYTVLTVASCCTLWKDSIENSSLINHTRISVGSRNMQVSRLLTADVLDSGDHIYITVQYQKFAL